MECEITSRKPFKDVSKQTHKMSAEKPNIVLKVKFHVTGTTHSGYCSDNDEEDPVNYYYSEEYEVDKDFVRRHIDKDDELDDYKLQEYSEYGVKKCGGSGYCKTSVNHIAVEGKLIEKKNLRAKFLAS